MELLLIISFARNSLIILRQQCKMEELTSPYYDAPHIPLNYRLLRYADVLLMYAEALNELNKTNEALPYINQIRQRAQVSSLMGLSQSQLRLAIEKERQLELCFEGHRWFDLKRTDRLLDVINEDFKNLGLTFSAKEYGLLLPIPQNQRDIDPNLTQNPGY